MTLKCPNIHHVLFTHTDVTGFCCLLLLFFPRNYLTHFSSKVASYPGVPKRIADLLFFSLYLLSLHFLCAYSHINVLSTLYI